jgi:hypothetical protein
MYLRALSVVVSHAAKMHGYNYKSKDSKEITENIYVSYETTEKTIPKIILFLPPHFLSTIPRKLK